MSEHHMGLHVRFSSQPHPEPFHFSIQGSVLFKMILSDACETENALPGPLALSMLTKQSDLLVLSHGLLILMPWLAGRNELILGLDGFVLNQTGNKRHHAGSQGAASENCLIRLLSFSQKGLLGFSSPAASRQ